MADMAGPVQILVVDDEEPIRNALKKYLTQQQFEVYTAGSGDEALQQLRRHRVALMLCDIRMPGTSGVDLVPQAIEIEPELAILMLTAVNDATSAALCMQRGAMDYLTKPIELADLGRAVQRALKRRESVGLLPDDGGNGGNRELLRGGAGVHAAIFRGVGEEWSGHGETLSQGCDSNCGNSSWTAGLDVETEKPAPPRDISRAERTFHRWAILGSNQ